MSTDGIKLFFEGFLQKRKDTMKLRWATYWFRLQNTTLFFYTQKNGSASHLRGHYYIYTVQAVREVQRVDSKRFMFEIIMTNGKRKVLAAETAALRKEWVGRLWQAMNLSTSDSRSTHIEVHEQSERLNSSTPFCPYDVIGSLPDHICPSEETPQQDSLPAWSCQHHHGDSLSGLDNPEGGQDYDILPPRKKEREINASIETDEALYDSPLSYRISAQHTTPTESIYDTPSTLLRREPDDILEEQPENAAYWRI